MCNESVQVNYCSFEAIKNLGKKGLNKVVHYCDVNKVFVFAKNVRCCFILK